MNESDSQVYWTRFGDETLLPDCSDWRFSSRKTLIRGKTRNKFRIAPPKKTTCIPATSHQPNICPDAWHEQHCKCTDNVQPKQCPPPKQTLQRRYQQRSGNTSRSRTPSETSRQMKADRFRSTEKCPRIRSRATAAARKETALPTAGRRRPIAVTSQKKIEGYSM